MLVLKFSFDLGRYHATEWGRNVNEGFVDWPPSPWRILRAIISSWKTYHPRIPEDKMSPIIGALVSSPPPHYRLPRATQSHTRHYMPIKKIDDEKSKIKKALTIDSFVSMRNGDAVRAVWSGVDLDPGQINTLRDVISTVRYLGRAESLCTASVEEESVITNCRPLGNASPDGAPNAETMGSGGVTDGDRTDEEVTDVLVPTADASLGDLCVTTAALHEEGRAYPPHTTLVPYARPADSLAEGAVPETSGIAEDITVVRYRIDSAVRPLVTETVEIGNRFKRAAMSQYRTVDGSSGTSASPNLSGMDAGGSYLRDGHSHAFYLPTDDDGDLRLDHITVVSRTPFDQRHLDALERVRFVKHSDERKKVTFLRRGTPNDFTLPIFGTATRWMSSTPFVPNRHIKRRGRGNTIRVIDGPEEQAKREIECRSIGKVKRIQSLPPRTWQRVYASGKLGRPAHGNKMLRPRTGLQAPLPVQFKTWRKIGLPGFGSYALDIEFDGPVQGPISLGHGAHYGLGMFVPYREDEK